VSLRACGARPSRGAKPGTNGLAGKTRRQRERWFSRRDAVSASAKPGRAQAEEQHDHGGANEHPVAQGGHARVNPTVSLRACGARPSRGVGSKGRWPSGESRELTRKLIFSEGRTLCVRLAGPHECRGIPFSPDDEPTDRLAYRAHASVNRKPPCGRAEPAPPRGQARHGWACGGRPGNDARDGFLGGAHSVRPQKGPYASRSIT
jgi:hypothetical protein